MRRLVPLAVLLGLLGVIGVRSWTSENVAPFRGQLQDVITLALSSEESLCQASDRVTFWDVSAGL